MINYINLDIEYDSLIIFDMLSDLERNKDGISRQLGTFLMESGFSADIFYLHTSDELFKTLNDLLLNVKGGKKYMFHFVSHGNENGIGFKHSNEFIPWISFEDILSEINTISGNTLVINMTTCFGINGIKIINPFSTEKAFFGLIGYDGKLQKLLSITANEKFYSLLMDGFKINEAVKILVADLKDKNFKCITSQGYSELTKMKRNNSKLI